MFEGFILLPFELSTNTTSVLFSLNHPSHFVTAGLVNTFSAYGPLSVEWPGKDGKHPRCPPKGNVAKGKVKLVG